MNALCPSRKEMKQIIFNVASDVNRKSDLKTKYYYMT